MQTFSTNGIEYDGTLNNVIVSYDTGKTTQFCLVNGIQAATSTSNDWIETSGLTIGARMYNSGNSSFIGTIKEVQVFNSQLTLQEATNLYNTPPPKFLLADDCLDFLTFNGEQYFHIKKPKTPVNSLKVIFEITPDTLSHSQPTFFGGEGVQVQLYRNTTSNLSLWTNTGSLSIGAFDANSINKLTVIMKPSSDTVILNGRPSLVSTTTQVFNKLFSTGCTSFTIGAYDVNSFPFFGNIYSIKMYSDDVLIYDFVPKQNEKEKYYFERISGELYYSENINFL